MITFETIEQLELATLKEGDLVQVLGEFSEGDVALMTGKVYPSLHTSSNRIVTIQGGLKVEIFPTPLGDKDVTKKYVNQQDNKIKASVNNLHTKREAIEYVAGLKVTDPLQLYSFENKEYLPDPSKIPFTTVGAAIDIIYFRLMKTNLIFTISTFDETIISSYPVGTLFQTKGFDSVGDNGEGLYILTDNEQGFTIKVGDVYAKLLSKPKWMSLGIKQGEAEASSNRTKLTRFHTKCRDEGLGVTYIGSGVFHLGDLSLPVTPTALNTSQGWIGDGVNNSKVIVNTSRKVLESGNNFKGFTLLDCTIENLNKKAGVAVSLVGGSNLQVKRVNANGFKKGFVFQVFLAEMENLNANECWLGFQWQGGTTINASTCYAHTCDYGHCFGGSLEDNETIKYRQLLNYNEFTNFAADSCNKSNYVFGYGASNKLSTIGAEVFPSRTSASMFMFPPVSGAPSESFKYNRDSGYTVENAFIWRMPKGNNVFDIRRECLQFELNGLVFSDAVVDSLSLFYKFTNVSPTTHDLQLKISNIDGINLGVASESVSYDGVYYGGFISKFKYGSFSDSYNPSQIFLRKKVKASITSHNGIRILLQGSKIKSATSAIINISVGGAGYSILNQASIGRLTVASTGDTSGCGFAQVFNGLNSSNLTFTQREVDGFTYLDVETTSTNIAHKFDIELETSASGASGSLIKYLDSL